MQDAGAQACAKHFIGNEQETQRNPSTTPSGKIIEAISSNIDDRTMHELYLWPFADAVRAGVSSIMCSYNRVNQTYACQNSKLLNGLLKEELGFQGYVMSDWQATHSGLSSIHAGNVNPPTLHFSSLTISVGLDMNMPGGLPSSGNDAASYFGRNITTAIHNGSLSEARLDDMIARVMTPYFYLKQNSSYPTVDPGSSALNSFSPQSNPQFRFILNGTEDRDVREDHATLIRNLGAASVVLLKNTNNTLPLSAPKVIGVFGNDAADLTDGLYPAGGFGSVGYNIGTLAVGGGSGSARFSYLVSPLEAIKARAAQDGSLVQYITDNVAATSAIDLGTIYPTPSVCLVFLKTFVTEGYDRTSYLADWDSTLLVTSVAGICNNTVVITHSGGPNVMPWADNPNVTGIIAAHLPGQETGNSLVDILYGVVNPSGRLPYTIGYNASDWNAPIIDVSITDATDPNAFQDDFQEGLMIDYRHFDSAGIKPRYEFGFGLSYTTFSVSNLTIQNVQVGGNITARPPKAPTQPGGNPTLYDVLFHATVTVSNTGTRAGQAVPQLYLSLPKSSTPSGTPVKVLRGFAKVSIEPSEIAEVGFDLLRRDISYWDIVSQDWVVPEGEMTVRVGFSSRDLPLTATIRARTK
jgi:beta-glucosidase